MRKAAISLILIYQRLAPVRVRDSCRFEPSCSKYAVAAIEKYGLLHGAIRALDRLCRCRPPNGGVDVL
jgi:hypothetical protein